MRRKRQKVNEDKSGGVASGEKHRAKLLFVGDHGGSIQSWKVKKGQQFEAGDLLAKCTCNVPKSESKPVLDLLAPYDGTLLSIEYEEGKPIPPAADNEEAQTVARISYCQHDIVLPGFGLCGVCGRVPSQLHAAEPNPRARFQQEEGFQGHDNRSSNSGAELVDPNEATSATMTLNVGGAKILVSRDEAEDERKVMIERLFKSKKLLLVLDIDHTMLHATDDPRAPAFATRKGLGPELNTFKLVASEEYNSPDKPHYAMLRPGLRKWLDELSKMYELYIYTAGTRIYAEAVAKVFDPSGELFGTRIITRTDVPELGKVKRLERFFPVDNSMVLAVDDRSDVWTEDASNLITIRPYHFFHGMADINNTSGPEFDLDGEREIEDQDEKHRNSLDHGLKRTLELLKWIHGKFYGDGGVTAQRQIEGQGMDVKKLVLELRARILRNQRLLIDTEIVSIAPKMVVDMSIACGGILVGKEELSKGDLVVISEDPKSVLALEAMQAKLWVVHPNWLMACIHNWNKEPYEHFVIFGVRKQSAPPKMEVENISPEASVVDSEKLNAEIKPVDKQTAPQKPVRYDEFGYPIEEEDEPSGATTSNAKTDGLDDEDGGDDDEEDTGAAPGFANFMKALGS